MGGGRVASVFICGVGGRDPCLGGGGLKLGHWMGVI